MSWTKKNVHPGKIVSTSEQVEVMVLDVDPVKRRISLGLKQCIDNPWESFLARHQTDDVVEGQVKSITEFGLFIGLDGDVDGMVHLSDLSWDEPGEAAVARYQKGDTVKAKVLEVSVERERIALGVKQLTDDPFTSTVNLKKGGTVTCTVTGIKDTGIDVTVGDGLPGFVRRADLARDRSEQRPDRFAPGDRVDARVTNVDRETRRITLSIKALEIADEKKAMAQYGSSDSGASLGDILGAAMSRRAEEESEAAAEDEAGSEGEAAPAVDAEAESETAAAPESEAEPVAEVAAEDAAEPPAPTEADGDDKAD